LGAKLLLDRHEEFSGLASIGRIREDPIMLLLTISMDREFKTPRIRKVVREIRLVFSAHPLETEVTTLSSLYVKDGDTTGSGFLLYGGLALDDR